MTSNFLRLLTAATCACAMASNALAQGSIGRITGRVTDRESRQPIDAAQIRIDGTTIGAISNAEGNYTIQRIAPGTYQLRLVRQYNRGAETVFPTGAYHKDNLTRGTDVNVAIPISEKNNPNFTGCLNRGA